MKYLSQQDPKWANVKLNGSFTTIGRDGCVVTSICMLAQKFGLAIYPDYLAKRCKFTLDGLIHWQTVAFDEMKFERREYRVDHNKIKEYIKAKDKGVILQVNSGTHWVYPLAWFENEPRYLVADPWDAKEHTTWDYKNITGAAFFAGKPIDQPQEAKITDVDVIDIGLGWEAIKAEYRYAATFINDATNGLFQVKFNFNHQPFEAIPFSHEYNVGGQIYFGLDPQFQKNIQGSAKVMQLCYEATQMYPEINLLSVAYREAVGSRQYNQINGGFGLAIAAVGETIVHELIHSWHFYLGMPDNLHAVEAEEKAKDPVNSRARALTRCLLEMGPRWGEL